jgi:hypothetical protein
MSFCSNEKTVLVLSEEVSKNERKAWNRDYVETLKVNWSKLVGEYRV